MPSYYLDCEFDERQDEMELISIGIVCSDGREFYRESSEYDVRRAHPWLKENVVPHLFEDAADKETRKQIASEVLHFCDPSAHGEPVFWGYYADYDWVLFCWLFGSMVDLPEGFPMFCLDLKQLAVSLGNPELPKLPEGEDHDALADARQHLKIHRFLEEHRVELLAGYAHEAWSGWMEYLFSKCLPHSAVLDNFERVETGGLVIPAAYVENLRALMDTPYAELSEADKESDRDEARKMIQRVGRA